MRNYGNGTETVSPCLLPSYPRKDVIFTLTISVPFLPVSGTTGNGDGIGDGISVVFIMQKANGARECVEVSRFSSIFQHKSRMSFLRKEKKGLLIVHPTQTPHECVCVCE